VNRFDSFLGCGKKTPAGAAAVVSRMKNNRKVRWKIPSSSSDERFV